MSRTLPVGLVALLAACGGSKGAKEDKGGADTASAATIAPPAACPVGDLLLSEARLQHDVAALDLWNALRTNGGACDGVAMPSTNALAADEALMWTARCWAFDISWNGAPAAPDQFTDGTPIASVAEGFGFTGILNQWGVQGDRVSTEAAFQAWVDGGGTGCTRLWDDALLGGTAVSGAGDILVVVRLGAFGPG